MDAGLHISDITPTIHKIFNKKNRDIALDLLIPHTTQITYPISLSGLDDLVFESSPPLPYRLWGPSSLLTNVRQGLFPGK